MTISSTTNRNEYAGAGSTGPYTYSFRIFASSDLKVIKRSAAGTETVLTLTTDYTVAGVGNATGTITLVTALASGETLVIRRVRPVVQETSIRNEGDNFKAAYEDELDKQVMIDQQVKADTDSKIGLKESYDPASYSLKVAPAASQVLAWNSAGTTLESRAVDGTTNVLLPAGRTVTTLSAYLANNAVFNIKDYGAVSGADSTTAITNCFAAACAWALANRGAAILIPEGGAYISTAEQVINQSYVTLVFEGSALIDYRPPVITTVGTVSATNGVATFTTAQTGVLREDSTINLPDETGVGTVGCVAGALTFSSSQAGKINKGSRITVLNKTYTILSFNGTTGATVTVAEAAFAAGSTFKITNRSFICAGWNAGMTTCTIYPHPTLTTFAASTFKVVQECIRVERLGVGAYPSKVRIVDPRFITPHTDEIPKTAIRIVDGSQCEIARMQIAEQGWDSPGAPVLHISGFELLHIHDCSVFGEQPLRISQCTRNPAIGLDSSSFRNNLWGCRGVQKNYRLKDREAILIDGDVLLTRVNMHRTALIRGTYGLFYDGLNATNCNIIHFSDLSREQAAAASDGLPAVFWSTQGLTYNLRIDGFSPGGGAVTNSEPGVGTVSASAGVLTYSEKQGESPNSANVSLKIITVGGVDYQQYEFTTSYVSTAYRISDGSLPTFGASAYTIQTANYLPTGNKGIHLFGVVSGGIDTAFYQGILEALYVQGKDFSWEGFWAQTGSTLTLSAGTVLTEAEYIAGNSVQVPVKGRVDVAVDRVATPGTYPLMRGENNVRKFEWSGTIAVNGFENIPVSRAGVGSWQVARVSVNGYSATGPINVYGEFHYSPTGVTTIAASASCTNSSTAGSLCVFPSTGTDTRAVVKVENRTAQILYVTIEAQGASD